MGFCLHIVSKNLSEPIRSHKDLDKDSALHYHKVVKFHEALAKQLVHQGHVLDLFACALDQVSIRLLLMIIIISFMIKHKSILVVASYFHPSNFHVFAKITFFCCATYFHPRLVLLNLKLLLRELGDLLCLQKVLAIQYLRTLLGVFSNQRKRNLDYLQSKALLNLDLCYYLLYTVA